MPYEWDAHKNETNLIKHGIDFETAQLVFEGFIVQREDTRKDYGETRIAAYGEVNNIVLFVIYTLRNNKKRIISARAANTKERSLYYAKRQDRLGTSS